MHIKARQLAPILALAASWAIPAQAATIAYSANYSTNSLTGPPFFVIPPVSLTQFDPTLGILQGVSLALTLNANYMTSLENISSSPHVVTAQNTGKVTLSGAGVTPFAAVTSFSVTRSLTAFDGNFDLGGTSGFSVTGSDSAQAQFNVALANFANFIGFGNYSATLVGNTLASVQGVNNGDYSSGFSASGAGVVTVTYTYAALVVPTPVPEPATWLMAIAGFGFMAAALRRSRPTGWRVRYT